MTTLGNLVIKGGIQTGPFGSQLHASDYTDHGVGVVMPQDLGDNIVRPDAMARVSSETAVELSRHRLLPGDIVFSRRGDVTRRSLIRERDGELLCGTGCLRVRIDPEKADPTFVSYAMATKESREWLIRHAVGATMPNLNTRILSGLPVRSPRLRAQHAMGEILGALDEKIAANRRLVENVDDFIRPQVASRLARSIKLWGALDFVFGEAFRGDSFSAPGIGRPLVRIRDLKSQKCQVWTTERRDSEYEVSPGDLLVGMDAEFRPTRWSGPEGVLNQRVLSASSDKYGPAIAREMLVAPLHRIERSKTGTTVIHLNKSDLLSEEVLAPADPEVPALRALVDPIWDRAIAAEQESVRLAATRDELLPLLMSGKITVKDAEKTVEEVV